MQAFQLLDWINFQTLKNNPATLDSKNNEQHLDVQIAEVCFFPGLRRLAYNERFSKERFRGC